MRTCWILVVDDQPCWHTLIAAVVTLDPHVTIVGQVAGGAAALAHLAHVQPDLVLTDVEMPGMDGFALTTQIKAQPQAPRVILMSGSGAGAAYRARAQAVGADGFVDKAEVVTALLPLIAALCAPDPPRDGSAC